MLDVILSKGVHVYITVWDKDTEGLFVDYDTIDEFDFDYVMAPGVVDYQCFDGFRYDPKSR